MRKRYPGLRLHALEARLAPAVNTWDGGGSDNNWSNPANWVGDVAPFPNAGDILVFPAGTARLTNTNDFPAGSFFRRIDFQGPDYQIGGNAIVLEEGITAVSPTAIDPASFPQVGLGLTMTTNSIITMSGDANLGVVLNGPIAFEFGVSLRFTGRFTVNGNISGQGSIQTEPGNIELVLAGTNTYSGLTSAAFGTIRIEGTQNPAAAIQAVTPIASLRGSGTAGPVFVSNRGALDPGTAGPGTFRAARFSSEFDGTLHVDVAGDAAGEFDQVVVGGDVRLGGPLELNVTGDVDPAARLRIIDNQGTLAVTGTFFRLPEGEIAGTVGGVRYRVTYAGGDGNDVELVAAPAPPEFTWDSGAGFTDTNWTTAANWVGDVAPVAGSTLVFPAVANPFPALNDYPAGTAFDGIILDANYGLGGNALVLSEGIRNVTDADIGATVSFGITLAKPQTFAAGTAQYSVSFSEPIDLNGFALTTSGGGSIRLFGSVTGGGGIVKLDGGTLALAGDNTYTGPTDVAGGTLSLGSDRGLGATGAGNDTRLADGTTLEFVTRDNRPVRTPEAIAFGTTASGTVSIRREAFSFAEVTFEGPLTLNARVAMDGTSGAIAVAGPLNGGGSLAGTNVFVFASSVSPTFTGVFSGSILFDGQAPAAGFEAGLLTGSGTIGPVTAGNGGTVSPGVQGIGTLRTGSLNIPQGGGRIIPIQPGNFVVDVTPAGVDQVRVTGTVNLGGNLLLAIAPGFRPTAGSRYRIIDNDGTDAVSNPFFTGLGEGAVVSSASSFVLRITFTGGDGNDVELVATTPGSRIAVGAGAGGGPLVRVFDEGANDVLQFLAYDSNFRGGVRVAQGDFTRDGVDDVVTAPGPGGGPHIRVWDGANGNLLSEFLAYEAAFTGGVNVAVGDINDDGQLEIVTGPDFGGGPLVRVFTLAGAPLGAFYAYDSSFSGGVTVAAGNVTGDAAAEIVTGAGRTGGSHVKVFDGVAGAVAGQFFAFDGFFGGVNVAVVNNSVAVTPKAGGGPIVRVFSAAGALQSQFITYPSDFRGGITVASRDVDGDGVDDVVTGPGPGGGPIVLALTAAGVQKRAFFAFDPAFLGGIFVG